MGLLTTLASLLGIETDLLLQRARENAIAFGTIGVFVAIGAFFLLVALYTWTVSQIGPLWAPLAIAGGAFLIALICFIVLRIQQASLKRQQQERQREAESRALITSAAIGVLPEILANPLVRNIGLPVALYAAFLMFVPPRKRPPTDKDGPRPS